MAINLPDLRAAVAAYIAGSVVTSISDPVAAVPNAISPGEEFTFRITATNAAAPTGIRLVNVRYRISTIPSANGSANVQLKVPATPPARADSNPTSQVLAVGSLVSQMFLFPGSPRSTLDVGDTDTVNGLKGKALALTNNATIQFEVHADPDISWLFPSDKHNQSASKVFKVQ